MPNVIVGWWSPKITKTIDMEQNQNQLGFQKVVRKKPPPAENMSLELVMKQLKAMDMRMSQISQRMLNMESNFNWTA